MALCVAVALNYVQTNSNWNKWLSFAYELFVLRMNHFFLSLILSSPAAHIIYALLKDGKIVVARFVVAECRSVTFYPWFLGSKEIPTCASNNNVLDINLLFFADINLCTHNCFVYNWVPFFFDKTNKKMEKQHKMFDSFFLRWKLILMTILF